MENAPLIAVRFKVRTVIDNGFKIQLNFDNSIKTFLLGVKTLKSFKTKEAYVIIKVNKLVQSRNSNFVVIRVIDERTINDWNLLFIYDDVKENIDTEELLAMFKLIGGNGDD